MVKKVLKNVGSVVMVAAMLLSAVSPSFALEAAGPSFGQTIQATPYDLRMGEAGVFEEYGPVTGSRSAESLFAKARSFRYKADEKGRDHWQTPGETESRWAGDCEDKAVWLYANLKMNGHKGVRLVVGRQNASTRGFHVWVVIEASNGGFFVLDPTAQKRIWNGSDFSRGEYRPLYSFDGINRYRHDS
jgi:hypothetical protein